MDLTLPWLLELAEYIKTKSFGLAAIRVLEYNNITFGIIEPYGYYLFNYKSQIYLMRDLNICIKFYVKDDTVVTAVKKTHLTITYIDSLFTHPPDSATKIKKFILVKDDTPHYHTVIYLINKCLDMRIFHL